ncbi:MAG: glutathione S-transferase N-terminal domain-containing protein [Desulfobulbaceae bacterium]|nr:glutathione S-transferase N-terminal domain-containing protein [Desulfobulbaceae bacterium]
MIILWGRASSANVQKVAWLGEELGLEVDRKDVGGPFGGLDTPEYIAMNPCQLIPTIQDGETTVWESEAVLRYLGAKYGTQFFPQDIEKRASVDKWMCWMQSTWFPAVYQAFITIMKVPVDKRSSAGLEQQLEAMFAKAAFMNDQLKDRSFVAGNSLSLADFSFAAWLYRYFTLEIDRPVLEYLEKYYDSLCARKAYVKHVHISYESMRIPGAERP